MNKEILLTAPGALCSPEHLTAGGEYDKWLDLPYEAGEMRGRALVATDMYEPAPLSLTLGVRGWHRIYLGLLRFSGGNRSGIAVQLGNGGKTLLEPKARAPHWMAHEWIEECFYRAADLSDLTLHLEKPRGAAQHWTSGVAYIRLVKMSDEEVAAYCSSEGGHTSFHFDLDFTAELDYRTVEECIGRVEMLEGTGGGILFLEPPYDGCLAESSQKRVYYTASQEERVRKGVALSQNKDAYCSAVINKAKTMGFRTCAAMRMQMTDFVFPLALYHYDSGVGVRYPQYQCKTRDGRTVETLSYAYPEVRRMAVEGLLPQLARGFDGLLLIFNRGMHIAFEQPVIDRVRALYGVDARRLPFADERLHGVLCEYMTDFMRELRAAVRAAYGEQKRIYVVGFYDAAASKHFGLDLETWAREDLIDGVCQGLMTHFEELGGCLDEDCLIDLDKFRAENARRPVLRRIHGNDHAMILNGALELRPICERYGKEFLATLLWENATPADTLRMAEELREIGVDKFFSWNANHKARFPDLWNAERAIARGVPCEEVRYVRVLSFAGYDISSFHQNWRG